MKFRAPATVMLLFTASVYAGDFENGVDAAARGEYQTALRIWQPLAEAGHIDAQFNIGLLYDNGAGVDRDPARAAQWYRRAADSGDATAQSYLAEMYARGDGVGKNLAEAVEWYRKAALQRDGLAAYNLGILYASGRGVPLDDIYAYAWLSVAEASGQSTNGVLALMASGLSESRKSQAESLRKELFAKCGLH